nr:hypothetical protein HmN_000915200 [Hymenolepis microstoma]
MKFHDCISSNVWSPNSSDLNSRGWRTWSTLENDTIRHVTSIEANEVMDRIGALSETFPQKVPNQISLLEVVGWGLGWGLTEALTPTAGCYFE